MNYSDKHKVLWGTPIRTAARSCISIQNYFEFNVSGNHDLEIPEGKEDYFFILNTRNPYKRMVSIYHLFCIHFKLNTNNFDGWIRQKLYEETTYPNNTLNYQILLKKNIIKTPDFIVRVENLYSDILNLPMFTDNSDELFNVIDKNISTNNFLTNYGEKEFYDQDLADYVYSHLEEDFVYFNYNKDSWKDGTS